MKHENFRSLFELLAEILVNKIPEPLAILQDLLPDTTEKVDKSLVTIKKFLVVAESLLKNYASCYKTEDSDYSTLTETLTHFEFMINDDPSENRDNWLEKLVAIKKLVDIKKMTSDLKCFEQKITIDWIKTDDLSGTQASLKHVLLQDSAKFNSIFKNANRLLSINGMESQRLNELCEQARNKVDITLNIQPQSQNHMFARRVQQESDFPERIGQCCLL